MKKGELTVKYTPFIRNTVKKFGSQYKYVDYQELEQVAILASLEAERIYDNSRGVQFHMYAKKFIHGALTRHLTGSSIRQNKIKRSVEGILDDYAQRGEIPTLDLIAEFLGIKKKTLKKVLKIPSTVFIPIVDDMLDVSEEYRELTEALEELTEEEFDLIRRKFYMDEKVNPYHLKKVLDKLKEVY